VTGRFAGAGTGAGADRTGRGALVAVLLLSGMGWGSTQVLAKFAVETGYRPFGLIFWQLVIGALILGAVLVLRRKPVPLNRATLTFAAVIALIGTILPNTAFYLAIPHLPAGIMSIIIAAVPLLSFPIALMLGMDRFTPARVAGLLCGMGGVALIALPESSLPTPAMAAWLPVALIGPLFYAIESNYVARYGTAGMDAVQAMFLASGLGAVVALPLALGSGQFIDPRAPWTRANWALLASSSVHVVAYCSYVWLAARAGAVFSSQTSYIVTGSGVLWAMVILGESYSLWVWAALALMLVGLALVQPRPRPEALLRDGAA
jgi:drug/metabolite transporter (DMT)-like permease